MELTINEKDLEFCFTGPPWERRGHINSLINTIKQTDISVVVPDHLKNRLYEVLLNLDSKMCKYTFNDFLIRDIVREYLTLADMLRIRFSSKELNAILFSNYKFPIINLEKVVSMGATIDPKELVDYLVGLSYPTSNGEEVIIRRLLGDKTEEFREYFLENIREMIVNYDVEITQHQTEVAEKLQQKSEEYSQRSWLYRLFHNFPFNFPYNVYKLPYKNKDIPKIVGKLQEVVHQYRDQYLQRSLFLRPFYRLFRHSGWNHDELTDPLFSIHTATRDKTSLEKGIRKVA